MHLDVTSYTIFNLYVFPKIIRSFQIIAFPKFNMQITFFKEII